MRVYKEQGELDMFLGITINNIRVSLYAFIFGVLFSIGSLYIIMQNAIMLGSFQYFFFEKRSRKVFFINGYNSQVSRIIKHLLVFFTICLMIEVAKIFYSNL